MTTKTKTPAVVKTAKVNTPAIVETAEAETKQEWIVGPKKITGDTKLKYKQNPKRKNSKAWLRYEAYQTSKTFAEYQKLNQDKQSIPDLKYDFSKGFVEIS